MARKPAALAAPSTAKELKDLLWKSADKLRGSMDASQYKDVVLGLVFLKYVSDAFEERQEQIWDELQKRVPNTELKRGSIFQRDVLRFRFWLDAGQLPRTLQIGSVGHTDWEVSVERRIDLTQELGR